MSGPSVSGLFALRVSPPRTVRYLLGAGGVGLLVLVWWFVTMERTCQVQLLAEAAGTPVLIDPDQAEKTAAQVGGRNTGWLQFQPLYDWIVEEQPGLLDE